MNDPLVSVVIPAYNMERFICDAVDSALSQTYKNIEVIVIDDGSKDRTKEILKKYAPNIRYIFKENAGLSAARNTGIKYAKGEYVAFLDADDRWLSQKIEKQIKAFNESDSIGLISCGVRMINESGDILAVDKKEEIYSNKNKFIEKLYLSNFVSGGSQAVVKRSCFEKVGFFDENIQSSEDWDMWLRIAEQFDIRFVKEVLVEALVRTASLSSASNAEKMITSDMYVIKKTFERVSAAKIIFVKPKAYSYRYFSAAHAFDKFGNIKKARKYIIRSIITYPRPSLS